MSENCVGWPSAFAGSLASSRNSPKRAYFKADISCISLADKLLWTSLNLRWLGLGGQIGEKLSCKFELDYKSDRKSSQVKASARNALPNLQVDPIFQRASTCESVWTGLNSVGKLKFIFSVLRLGMLHYHSAGNFTSHSSSAQFLLVFLNSLQWRHRKWRGLGTIMACSR